MCGEQRRPTDPKARVPGLLLDGWVVAENPAMLQFTDRAFPDARPWPENPRDSARAPS